MCVQCMLTLTSVLPHSTQSPLHVMLWSGTPHRKKEKRRREAELRATQTLGAAGDDVDDLAAWAAKIKPKSAAEAAAAGAAEAAAGRPSKRQKGSSRAAAAAGSDEGDDDHTAADLAGVNVRHDLENLTEGEAVVLTLADTGEAKAGLSGAL